MRIRYIPADPAGNLTGLVLTHVSQEVRPALAARLMAVCPEGFEQIAFIDEDSLTSPLPRMEMMGGEFCGNASRAFGWYAAQRRRAGASGSAAAAPARARGRGCCAGEGTTGCMRLRLTSRAGASRCARRWSGGTSPAQ